MRAGLVCTEVKNINMAPVNIRYDADTWNEMDNSTSKAKIDFDRLVKEGYPHVRIVVSNHWASEGVWVEAGNKLEDVSAMDLVIKEHK